MEAKLSDQQRFEQTLAACTARAQLWRDFVSSYQGVLITAPETFSAYCEKFRASWLLASQAGAP